MMSRNQYFDLMRKALVFSIPLLIAQVYFKYTYLRYGGIEILERAVNTSNLGLTQYLSLYSQDIVETLVIVPFVLFLTGVIISKSGTVLFQIITGLLLLAGVISWTSYHVIGSFPSQSLVQDYFQTLMTDPEIVSPLNVLSMFQLIKIAAILSLAALPLFINRWISQKRTQNTVLFILLFLLLLPAGVLSLTSQQQTVFHQGNIQRMVSSMMPDGDIELPESEGLSASNLKQMYLQNVFPGKSGDNPGTDNFIIDTKKSNPNVIFIVLETASLDDFNLYSSKSEMPHVTALLENSLIAKNHFSAYPYSIRANYSMFSSIYDMPTRDMMVDYLIDENPIKSEALPKVLSNEGYKVKYYYPVPLTQGDKERWMLTYLGFDEIWEGPKHKGGNVVNSRARNEELMFDEAIKDIHAKGENAQPFFLSLVSAIGHAPYPSLDENGHTSRSEKITGLKRFMDRLVGKLTEHLKQQGQLDNTMLVITGDHGVRNKVEDPTINLSYSNRRSYNVPLVIFYPPMFKKMQEIDWVTSHIDIAPTVLSLMGRDKSKYLYQGESILNPVLKERVTFFWGGHYFGTNAMHYRGKYYMENIVTGIKLLNDNYLFETDNVKSYAESAKHDDDTSINFTDIMNRQKNIQYSWASYMRGRN